MRRGALELGFKEIVIATVAVVAIIIFVILLMMIINPAAEVGNIWGRRATQ